MTKKNVRETVKTVVDEVTRRPKFTYGQLEDELVKALTETK